MSRKPIPQIIENNIGVIVVSCDKYSDVWPYFFENFFSFWESCPFNIYLLNNKETYKKNNIINLSIGKDISWSSNLKKGLKKINKEYVILILDDLIINRKISIGKFYQIIEWVNNNSPNHLRLHISTKPKFYDRLVGKLPMKSPYKVSLMPAIWNRNFLLNILNDNESAWDFEVNGTKRVLNSKGFFSLYKSFIFYDNSIVKSKWQRKMIDKLNIKRNSRPVMLINEQFIYNLKVLRSKVFNFLPNYLRIKLKKI